MTGGLPADKDGQSGGLLRRLRELDDRFLGSRSRKLGWAARALPATVPLAYVLGAVTVVMLAGDVTAGGDFGALWVATGLVLTAVAAGLVELWLSRTKDTTRATVWVIASVVAPPVALIALSVSVLSRASRARRTQRL